MPMSGAVLGPAIASALAGLSDSDKANTAVIWTKISEAIIAHIKTQGVVSTTGSPSAQTGTIS